MRTTAFLIIVMSLAAVSVGQAQNWEVGGAAGAGFSSQPAVSGPAGSGSAGLATGVAAAGFVAHNMYSNVSGELRYTYRQSDLKVSANGESFQFRGQSHSVHYDVLVYAKRSGARLRPFLAVGGGVRMFRGTGEEQAYQPLSEYALPTRTQEIKPLVTFGGGIKCAVSERVFLRVEVRDYFTQFPEKVIAAAPGVELGSWLHDIVPLVGVSFRF